MSWGIEYIPQAAEDFDKLHGSQKKLALKALNKVAQNPLPDCEGGYGKGLSFRTCNFPPPKQGKEQTYCAKC